MNETWNLGDPYVFEALSQLQNQSIAVQTARGSVRGVLQYGYARSYRCSYGWFTILYSYRTNHLVSTDDDGIGQALSNI